MQVCLLVETTDIHLQIFWAFISVWLEALCTQKVINAVLVCRMMTILDGGTMVVIHHVQNT